MRAATVLVTLSSLLFCRGSVLGGGVGFGAVGGADGTRSGRPALHQHLTQRPRRAPPYRGPPPAARPMQPANTTASELINALAHNWFFMERVTVLTWRWARCLVGAINSWCVRLLGYPPRVVVVRLQGVIATEDEMRADALSMLEPSLLRAESPAMRGGDLINLQKFEQTLGKAFATPGAQAVALLIDSPGGSPAQSSLLYARLRALRARHPRVQLLAFVEDAAASGGYYIACAADEIIADPNSLVGSVGVISRGFGYVRAIKKKGMERRVHSAGESKSGLDPFLPMRKQDLARQKRLLKELHGNFIKAVAEGRGDRLQRTEAACLSYNTSASASWMPSLIGPSQSTLRKLVDGGAGIFDGSIYSGSTALELGLVDRVGEMRTELQRRYGRLVHVITLEPAERVDYTRLLRWLL